VRSGGWVGVASECAGSGVSRWERGEAACVGCTGGHTVQANMISR